VEKLSGWLVMEQCKSRNDRRTAKLMRADLVKLGFDGSYERVAAFVRAWKADLHARSRRLDREHLCRWCFSPAKRSNLIGVRIGPLSAVSGSSFRSPIASCHIAVRFWCGPICCRHTSLS
jgi:hypothetical protein